VLAVPAWRIVLADDHPVVRAGLRMLLAAEPRCRIVGEAASLSELDTTVRHLQPDLVLLDLGFGTDTALDLLPAFRSQPRPPKVIMLTMHDDVVIAREALSRGAHGYLIKDAAGQELIHAIETVMSGAGYLDPALGARMASSPINAADQLTARERDVLVRLARGHTNAEVARQLMISLRTVESYRAALRARLGGRTRADMVAAARRLGLPT
jgi:two-component system, NarL family, response regulator NreC